MYARVRVSTHEMFVYMRAQMHACPSLCAYYLNLPLSLCLYLYPYLYLPV